MRKRRPFRFSLLALLVMVTITCIVLAIMKDDWKLGCIFGIIILGAWIAYISVIRRQFRIAHFAVGFASGQVLYLAASLPISFLGLCFRWNSWCLASSLYLCCTSLIATSVLHLWWRGNRGELLTQAVVLTYVSPVIFLFFVYVGDLFSIRTLELLPEPTVLSVVAALCMVTASLHVALPAWIFVMELLNSIDELEHGWLLDQYEVTSAVDKLQRIGNGEIFLEQILKHVSFDEKSTINLLDHLRQVGELELTPFGYRRTRPQ